MDLVVADSVYALCKETFGILYWIGMWSIIMPSSGDDRTVAWTCLAAGLGGVSVCIVADRIRGAGVAPS